MFVSSTASVCVFPLAYLVYLPVSGLYSNVTDCKLENGIFTVVADIASVFSANVTSSVV